MKKNILYLCLLAGSSVQPYAQGTYVEYKTSTGQSGVSAVMKIYTSNGNTRSEMNTTSTESQGGFNRVTLMLKDSLKKSYVLNEKNKTYTVIDMGHIQLVEKDPAQYEVTVVGKEKVDGYNCTHVKIIQKEDRRGEDMWVSPDVLNYQRYLDVKSKYTSEGLFKAFAAKGVAGFPVRIEVGQADRSMQIDLVKAEIRNNDPSLFSLNGYTPAAIVAGPGNSAQEMMNKIQNMTPEERKQFIDKMRQQNEPAH